MKKIVLVFAAVAAVFVLAAVILFFVVDADDFRGFIETRAEEVLDRDVRLGTIGLSIVPVFGLQVDDVAVAARPGEGDGDLLSVGSVRIGAKLMPLLKKRLEVTSVEVIDPVINLVRDADGNWNFDLGAGDEVAEPEGQTGAGPEVTIGAMRVTGGRFSVRDASRFAAQPLEVALADLDLELSGFGSDEVRIVVESGLLDMADPEFGPDALHMEVGEVDLGIRGGGDSVELALVELIVGKTTLALTGTVETRPDGWLVDIDLKPTEIEVEDLSSLLQTFAGDLEVSITGDRPVELEAGVHGPVAENLMPEIDVMAKLTGLTIDTASLTQPVTGVNAVVGLQGNSVAVDGLRARVGESDFAGTLQLAFLDRPVLEFSLESKRADLGELLGLMAGGEDGQTDQAPPPDPDSFLVRGLADGTLKVTEGSWINLHFRDLDARLRLDNGVATLEPVSMELYGGRFSGRLASDLTARPQAFEFSGEAEGIDMDPFVADQTGMSEILTGRFTGRVAGQAAGTDPTTVIRSLQGGGVAQVVDGQVGKLDVLRSVGQVAGVLGQNTLANLASESAEGATKFSRLAGDFHIGDGALNFDSVLLESTAFDLSGTGSVDLLSSVMNGEFLIQFSPEVSAWMKQESSRAAELFWDSPSDRVVLPLGLSGPLDGTGASVDWGAAVEQVARRTVERELNNVLGNLLGGSSDDKPDGKVVTSPAAKDSAPAKMDPAAAPMLPRRAKAPSGKFAIRVVKTEWGGPPAAQNFQIKCKLTGTGAERAVMKAVDAAGNKVQNAAVDLAALLVDTDSATFEVRVSGKRLTLAQYPVTVTLTAFGADDESAVLVLEIEEPAS